VARKVLFSGSQTRAKGAEAMNAQRIALFAACSTMIVSLLTARTALAEICSSTADCRQGHLCRNGGCELAVASAQGTAFAPPAWSSPNPGAAATASDTSSTAERQQVYPQRSASIELSLRNLKLPGFTMLEGGQRQDYSALMSFGFFRTSVLSLSVRLGAGFMGGQLDDRHALGRDFLSEFVYGSAGIGLQIRLLPKSIVTPYLQGTLDGLAGTNRVMAHRDCGDYNWSCPSVRKEQGSTGVLAQGSAGMIFYFTQTHRFGVWLEGTVGHVSLNDAKYLGSSSTYGATVGMSIGL
jgi:hypothetical protein